MNDSIFIEQNPLNNSYEPMIQTDSFTGGTTVSVLINLQYDEESETEPRYFTLFAFSEENDDLIDNNSHYCTDLIIVPTATFVEHTFHEQIVQGFLLLDFARDFKKSKRAPIASVIIKFEDDSVYSPIIDQGKDKYSRWFFSEEEYRMLTTKRIKAIRVEHTGNGITDYVFDKHDEDYKFLAKDLPDAFMDFIRESVALLKSHLGWTPPNNSTIADSVSEEAFECSADVCYVYLMLDKANCLYKIGMSNNPTYRESTLQGEKPSIEKICEKKFPSRRIASAIESTLHKVFEEKRTRGEWFRLDPIDVWQIKQSLS